MSEERVEGPPEASPERQQIEAKLAQMQRERQTALHQHQTLAQQADVARMVVVKYDGAIEILTSLVQDLLKAPMPVPDESPGESAQVREE